MRVLSSVCDMRACVCVRAHVLQHAFLGVKEGGKEGGEEERS